MNNTSSVNSIETVGIDAADAKDAVLTTASKANRMKGMKIRDEFICPITYELMRDPVVASDGHTYEKAAIDKWLKHHQLSPRTNEPMAPLTIPNINMKKLIQDIIDEVEILLIRFWSATVRVNIQVCFDREVRVFIRAIQATRSECSRCVPKRSLFWSASVPRSPTGTFSPFRYRGLTVNV
jgi:hypothetical protein